MHPRGPLAQDTLSFFPYCNFWVIVDVFILYYFVGLQCLRIGGPAASTRDLRSLGPLSALAARSSLKVMKNQGYSAIYVSN